MKNVQKHFLKFHFDFVVFCSMLSQALCDYELFKNNSVSKNWDNFDRREHHSRSHLDCHVLIDLPMDLREKCKVRLSSTNIVKHQNLEAKNNVSKCRVKDGIVQNESCRINFRIEHRQIEVTSLIALRHLPRDVESGVEDCVEAALTVAVRFV